MFCGRRGTEGPLAREHRVADRAKRIDVGGHRWSLRCELFGRSVLEAANGIGPGRMLQVPIYSEIHQLQRSGGGDQYVAGVKIAMDHIARMQLFEAFAQVVEQLEEFGCG